MKNDATWMDAALCRQVDPNLFHPEPGEGARTQARQAIQVCAQCPVIAECHEWAKRFSRGYGVWAGVYRSPGRGVRAEIEHGTEGGAKQHYRRDEPPCGECRRAATLANALRKDRRRSA